MPQQGKCFKIYANKGNQTQVFAIFENRKRDTGLGPWIIGEN